MAGNLSPQHRELAGRTALLAAQRFRAFGWTWGYPEGHVPDVEEIAAVIEGGISVLIDEDREDWSSGRLAVRRNSLYGIEVLLSLGGYHEDDGLNVDIDDDLVREAV